MDAARGAARLPGFPAAGWPAADAPRAAAAPVKTLRYILPAAETGFDPATARDLYSNHITQAVFDTLYTYDYLARPVKVVPQRGRGHAGSVQRRQDLHHPPEKRHPVHARCRVRRQAPRTDHGRLCVFVEAPVRPAPGLAAQLAVRRQGRRPRRPREGSGQDRTSSTTTRRWRAWKSSTPTPCASR